MFAEKIPKMNLWGIETDPHRIEQLKEIGVNVLQIDPKVTTFIGIESNSFDFVFSSNVLEHIPYRQYLKYLGEINRVLVPGGAFLVGMPNYPFKRL